MLVLGELQPEQGNIEHLRFRNFHMRQLHIHFLFVVKYQTINIEHLALLTFNTNIIAYLHYGLRTFTKKPNLNFSP